MKFYVMLKIHACGPMKIIHTSFMDMFFHDYVMEFHGKYAGHETLTFHVQAKATSEFSINFT